MSAFFIDAGGPSAIGLKAVATPQPGLTTEDLLERLGDTGQHIEDVRPEGVVLADVVYQNGLYLDHSEADEGELVWACDFCGLYSRTKTLVEDHEPTCHKNPEAL